MELRDRLLVGGVFLYCLTLPQLVAAQVMGDGSTTTEVGSCGVQCVTLTGSTTRGSNLFHSFREFNVNVDQQVRFTTPTGIKNILARVTGNHRSNIQGTLGVEGGANLFLLNPNGIIFGSHAQLNLQGSFVATTANSFVFSDGSEFSAAYPQSPPLLAIDVPVGLQFGQTPGEIRNESTAPQIDFTTGNPILNNQDATTPGGLQVAPGRSLALIGGSIAFADGSLTAVGGRIDLGSVAGGQVRVRRVPGGFSFRYGQAQSFQDIQLSHAFVHTSGDVGGAIEFQGRNVSLTNGSDVSSTTFGEGTGAPLVINASGSVTLRGGSFGGSFFETFTEGKGDAGDIVIRASDSVTLGNSRDIIVNAPNSVTSDALSDIASQVCFSGNQCERVTGNGGNLIIQARKLQIQDGARIDFSTFGSGHGGNILVRSSNIRLIGAVLTSDVGLVTSGIVAQVGEGAINNAGDAGNISIEARRLSLLEGGNISAATFSGGNGGNLNINASGSVQLTGSDPNATLTGGSSGLFVSSELGRLIAGDVGNLNITTRLLTVENGAKISADNFGSGQGGTANLNVRQLVIRDGGLVRAGSFGAGAGGTLTVNATESIGLSGRGTIGSTRVFSELFTQAGASGAAGNLNIATGSLDVRDGARVTVSNIGSGAAGNLAITANTIRLDRGSLAAETRAGEGGNITLQDLNQLAMQNQSRISAQARNSANGGNVIIAAGAVTAVPDQNNDILANADRGNGGNILIFTRQPISGFEQPGTTLSDRTNDINASSQFGQSGTVSTSFPVDTGLQPVSLASAEPAQGCQVTGGQAIASFFNTGRGGLPPTPYEPLSSTDILDDVRLPSQDSSSAASQPQSDRPIVEANGWIVGTNGKVMLMATAPDAQPQGLCHLR